MRNKLLSLIITICFIIVSFVTALDLACFNLDFFRYEYSNLNIKETIGISDNDLIESTEVLLDYIQDKRENISVEVEIGDQTVEMFNQREIDHMVDVKNLYLNVKTIAFLASIVLVVCIGLFVYKNDYIYRYLRWSFNKVMLTLSAVLGGLLTFAIIDFYKFWTMFHEIFFSNDLWLLNPNTDRMILMVPSEFFFDLIFLILIIFIFLLIIYYFIIKIMVKKEIKNDNTHRTI